MLVLFRFCNRVLAGFGVHAARLAVADALAERGAHEQAFPLFAQAARAASPAAQYRLGRCYLLGLGVPPGRGEALRWLRRSAEAGETAAQTQLATLALQGVSDRPPAGLFDDAGAESDFARAEHWCRAAVARGSAEAKALLAYILTDGPVERRDVVAGEALYREAAADGWPRGKLGLAVVQLREGGPEATAEAEALLHAAAADGIAAAHHLLGMLAESGADRAVDFEAAAGHYQEAAAMGYGPAQVRFGFALMHGRGVQQDVFTAETWLRKAALAGDAQAAAVVGFLYARDGELPPNYAEAVIWLRRAAEAGHVAGARTLGRMLLMGNGVPRDLAEATFWLRQAAVEGDGEARKELGRLAVTGQLGGDVGDAVVVLLREGAAAGDPVAQYDLGLCLAQGIGGCRDEAAALGWIRRAAEGGHADAERMLGALGG